MSTNNINSSFDRSIPNGETVQFRKKLVVLLQTVDSESSVVAPIDPDDLLIEPLRLVEVLITRPQDVGVISPINSNQYSAAPPA